MSAKKGPAAFRRPEKVSDTFSPRLRLACAAALLAVLLAAGCANAVRVENAPQNHPWAQKIELTGAPNLHKVSDDLYRGAQPTAEGFQALQQLGIRTVVDLRAFHDDKAELGGLPLQYVHISSHAWNAEDEDVVAFLRVAADKAHAPVFVHCQHGADRTGLMAAAYRIVIQGWTKEEAMMEMTQGGFGFHGWPNLVKYIRKMDVERIRREAGLVEQGSVLGKDEP